MLRSARTSHRTLRIHCTSLCTIFRDAGRSNSGLDRRRWMNEKNKDFREIRRIVGMVTASTLLRMRPLGAVLLVCAGGTWHLSAAEVTE